MNPLNARRSRSDVVATSPRGERRGFQIGPRIRIGGSVGKLGQKVKIGAGKVLSNKWVDAGLALIPGVGPGIAAAANATGHVLDTSGGGIHSAGDIGKIALDSGLAYAGGKAANIARDAFISGGVKGAIKQGVSSLGGKIKGAITGGGADGVGHFGQAGDMLGKAGDFAGGGGGSGVDKLLIAAMIADAAAKSKRQNELQDKGLAYATDAYSAKQPLRRQGLAQLQSQTAPDLSGIFGNAANPYQKTQPVPVAPRTPILPSGGTY